MPQSSSCRKAIAPCSYSTTCTATSTTKSPTCSAVPSAIPNPSSTKRASVFANCSIKWNITAAVHPKYPPALEHIFRGEKLLRAQLGAQLFFEDADDTRGEIRELRFRQSRFATLQRDTH